MLIALQLGVGACAHLRMHAMMSVRFELEQVFVHALTTAPSF